MKKTGLIVLLSMVCIDLGYTQYDYRNAFMGNWIWHNNTDTFRIKFKKIVFQLPKGDVPALYGYHEYKKGNQVLESSLKDYDKDTDMKLGTIRIFWSPRQEKPDNMVKGYIMDVEYKDYMRDLILTLSPDKRSMQFEATDTEGIIFIIDGVPTKKTPDNRTFYFPKNVVFSKEGEKPIVFTTDASTIKMYTATLNGTIKPNNPVNANLYFEYGTTTNYDKRIMPVPATINGNSPVNISAVLNNLSKNTTYYYRVFAKEDNGLYHYGEHKSFNTSNNPIPIISNVMVSGNRQQQTISLSGTVNANNLNGVKVYFEYDGKRVSASPSTVSGSSSTKVVGNIVASSNAPTSYSIVCVVDGESFYGTATTFTLPTPDKTKPFQ